MWLRNTTAIVSLAVILLCSACATLKGNEGDRDGKKTSEAEPFTVEGLSFSDNSQALADFAEDMACRSCSREKKEWAYEIAKKASALKKTDSEIALVLAKTAFFLADCTDNDSRMIEIAETGTKAAELAGANEKPVPSYYYAVNLGRILQVKGLFALNKIPIMEKALLNAVKKPKTDLGGPYRALGMLYLKAPAWPKGIGDIDKALDYLSRAANEFPGHPLNHIFYAEALIEDGQTDEATNELEIARHLIRADIWGKYYAEKWRGDIDRLMEKL